MENHRIAGMSVLVWRNNFFEFPEHVRRNCVQEAQIPRTSSFFKLMWNLFSPDISISWPWAEIYRTFDAWRRDAKFGKVRRKHARDCRRPAVLSTFNSLMKIGWYLEQPFFFTCRSEVLRTSDYSSFLVIHHTHKLKFLDGKWNS